MREIPHHTFKLTVPGVSFRKVQRDIDHTLFAKFLHDSIHGHLVKAVNG